MFRQWLFEYGKRLHIMLFCLSLALFLTWFSVCVPFCPMALHFYPTANCSRNAPYKINLMFLYDICQLEGIIMAYLIFQHNLRHLIRLFADLISQFCANLKNIKENTNQHTHTPEHSTVLHRQLSAVNRNK